MCSAPKKGVLSTKGGLNLEELEPTQDAGRMPKGYTEAVSWEGQDGRERGLACMACRYHGCFVR